MNISFKTSPDDEVVVFCKEHDEESKKVHIFHPVTLDQTLHWLFPMGESVKTESVSEPVRRKVFYVEVSNPLNFPMDALWSMLSEEVLITKDEAYLNSFINQDVLSKEGFDDAEETRRTVYTTTIR